MDPTATLKREARRASKWTKTPRDRDSSEFNEAIRLVAPWALLGSTLALAFVARNAFALTPSLTPYTRLTAVCFALLAAVLTGVSFHLTRERRGFGRVIEALNTAAPPTVIAYTLEYGVRPEFLIPAATVGVGLAYLWNRRHIRHAAGELAVSEQRGSWDDFTKTELTALAGSRIDVIEDSPERAVAGMWLPLGKTVGIVGNLLEEIGTYFGAIRGGTDMQVGAKHDRVLITATRKDPLDLGMQWAGPSGPGESIAETIEGLGIYRNKLDLRMLIPHTELPNGLLSVVAHTKMVGRTRIGKSAAGELAMVNIGLRGDAGVVFCDAVKADQSVGAIEGACCYVLDTEAKIKNFLWRLVYKTIPARAAYLGNPNRNPLGKRLREWEPGCGLTWITVYIAEGAALYGVQTLLLVSERAASVGIELRIELQRASHDRVDTTMRANNAAGIAFACDDDGDAAMVLSPRLMQLGVTPSAWGPEYPGKIYYEAPGIPESLAAMPARFARHARDGSDIEAAIAEYRHLMNPVDPITAASWGPAYEKYRADRARRRGREPVMFSTAPPIPATVAPHRTVVTDTAPRPTAPAMAPAAAVRVPPTPPAPGDEPLDGEPRELDADQAPDELSREQLAGIADVAADEVLNEFEQLAGDDVDGEQLRTLAERMLGTPDGDADEPFEYSEVDDVDLPTDLGTLVHDAPDAPELVDDKPPPASRAEALAIAREVLWTVIGEGEEFGPKNVYGPLAERVGKADTWFRQQLPIMLARGWIDQTEKRGKYIVLPGCDPEADDLDDYRK
ncbi:hypothetical protein [Nonomuraea sp. NEAU-A123]|uniref:hypothetical protein n=1 Tax=Nonomuraea sp. NEAU-A123 TaxID=2839649 RepID=UPI001BE44E2E|nr:hypothetical protein [Nonomuraea sp. NEAU-A123]MBT2226288.1 hypothetical protein [Nonomuraea sp. NEAU-A123]